jgi:hypothetical protein
LVDMTPPKKYMYVNPIGIPMREITRVNVALNSTESGSIPAVLGGARLVDDRMRRTVEEPMRKRMKVLAKQMSKFRRRWDFVFSLDNLARMEPSVAGQYLGRLVLQSAQAS